MFQTIKKYTKNVCLCYLSVLCYKDIYPECVSDTSCQVEWTPLGSEVASWHVHLLIIKRRDCHLLTFPAFVTLLHMVKFTNKILLLRIILQMEGYFFFAIKSQAVLKQDSHTPWWPISGVAGPWLVHFSSYIASAGIWVDLGLGHPGKTEDKIAL